MRFSIVTMFPEYFSGPIQVGNVRRSLEAGLVQIDLIDLREYGNGPHRQLDDAPFGGGPGMVMMVEPLALALDPLAESRRILFAATGRRLLQADLDRWSTLPWITLVCGRYEGIDQRVIDHFVEEEVSLGDYVLAGGEAAAAVVLEGVVRLVHGVVGNPLSVEHESFRGGLLEEPQYTRPSDFRGWKVPDILLSGDHAAIHKWRLEQRVARTKERRPDLVD